MKDVEETEEIEETGPSPDLEPLEVESLRLPIAGSNRSWPQILQSSFLLLFSVASLGVAAIGFSLLVYIFFSRSFVPSSAHLVKDLYFDYSDTSAVARATLLDSKALKASQMQPLRKFYPGQKLNIWLELEAAEAYGNINTDLFQVLGQLLTSQGTTAATASRPCILHPWSPLVQFIRSMFSAPMVLAGLWREHQLLKVPLFSRYPDQLDKPFTEFRTVLRAANSGGHLPHLYSAKLHVDLVLGVFGRVIYLLRPGTWTMLALAAGSLAAIGGGLLVAAMTFAVWLYSSPKAHAPADKLPLSDDLDQDEDRNSELVTSKLGELNSAPREGGRFLEESNGLQPESDSALDDSYVPDQAVRKKMN